ncbi:MAG: hypothetical protein FD134_2616 [Gallionellaceae bacterium]|nr:MAG: hypothetical protein FD134_2616 [Gallionellaceae bacterium]
MGLIDRACSLWHCLYPDISHPKSMSQNYALVC